VNAASRCRCLRHRATTRRRRLTDIRDNLITRIAEAEREGWLGEVEGLKISLTGTEEKIAQLDRRPSGPSVVDLGLPVIINPDSPNQPRSSETE
jgi:hypothetical protein